MVLWLQVIIQCWIRSMGVISVWNERTERQTISERSDVVYLCVCLLLQAEWISDRGGIVGMSGDLEVIMASIRSIRYYLASFQGTRNLSIIWWSFKINWEQVKFRGGGGIPDCSLRWLVANNIADLSEAWSTVNFQSKMYPWKLKTQTMLLQNRTIVEIWWCA